MTADPTPTQAEQDADYYREVLHDLIGMGTAIARHVHDQALQAPTDAASHVDPTLAFDRIARAIRRTILLARKLAEPAAEPPTPDRRTAARKRILREVEDTIQRAATPAASAPLHAELLDRLDAPDLDDDIRLRPVPEIIADICRDLGLAAPHGPRAWKRRTPQDTAVLHLRAAAPPRPPPDVLPGPPRQAAPPHPAVPRLAPAPRVAAPA